jgi:hypothetical protein
MKNPWPTDVTSTQQRRLLVVVFTIFDERIIDCETAFLVGSAAAIKEVEAATRHSEMCFGNFPCLKAVDDLSSFVSTSMNVVSQDIEVIRPKLIRRENA